jgi:hypothetical protein
VEGYLALERKGTDFEIPGNFINNSFLHTLISHSFEFSCCVNIPNLNQSSRRSFSSSLQSSISTLRCEAVLPPQPKCHATSTSPSSPPCSSSSRSRTHNSNSSSKCSKEDSNNNNDDKNHKTCLRIHLGISRTMKMVLSLPISPLSSLPSLTSRSWVGSKLMRNDNSTLHKLSLPRHPSLCPFPAPLPMPTPDSRREV